MKKSSKFWIIILLVVLFIGIVKIPSVTLGLTGFIVMCYIITSVIGYDYDWRKNTVEGTRNNVYHSLLKEKNLLVLIHRFNNWIDKDHK